MQDSEVVEYVELTRLGSLIISLYRVFLSASKNTHFGALTFSDATNLSRQLQIVDLHLLLRW